MKFVEDSVVLLGLGSVALGVWGLIHPQSLAGMMGDDPELGRLLATRDLVVGVALLENGGPVSLAMRLTSDLHDAVRLRKRSPMAALGAAAVALWAGGALAGSLIADQRERIQLSVRIAHRS